jgi:hypothetical protein
VYFTFGEEVAHTPGCRLIAQAMSTHPDVCVLYSPLLPSLSHTRERIGGEREERILSSLL